MSKDRERIHDIGISFNTNTVRGYSPHFVTPEDSDEFMLEVIEEDPIDEADEERWDKTLAESADKLAELADQAMAEHRTGRTQPLDPDKL
jgi:hypothetical protein